MSVSSLRSTNQALRPMLLFQGFGGEGKYQRISRRLIITWNADRRRLSCNVTPRHLSLEGVQPLDQFLMGQWQGQTPLMIDCRSGSMLMREYPEQLVHFLML